MIKTPDYTQISDASKELGQKAHKVWQKRSKDEQNGIYAGLVGLLIVGLVAMIWRAGRTSSSRYVEVPSRDDDWF